MIFGIKSGRWAIMFVVFSVLLLCAGGATAEMYKWVDDEGRVNFTDNLFNVPQQYLSQVSTYGKIYDKGDSDIPLKKTELGYMVEVVLNGIHKMKLILDTGATATVVSPSALAAAGIAVDEKTIIKVRTAGGEATAKLAHVNSLSVGPFKQGPLRIIAHDAVAGSDGLLGMDFLGAYRFEILTIGPSLRLTPQ